MLDYVYPCSLYFRSPHDLCWKNLSHPILTILTLISRNHGLSHNTLNIKVEFFVTGNQGPRNLQSLPSLHLIIVQHQVREDLGLQVYAVFNFPQPPLLMQNGHFLLDGLKSITFSIACPLKHSKHKLP